MANGSAPSLAAFPGAIGLPTLVPSVRRKLRSTGSAFTGVLHTKYQFWRTPICADKSGRKKLKMEEGRRDLAEVFEEDAGKKTEFQTAIFPPLSFRR